MTGWTPFRPNQGDLEDIRKDIAAISEIQKELVANHPNLKLPDRVAHQYQIAGGKVELKIHDDLPEALDGVGIFKPGATHVGVGRVSTGLGCPHLETDPDFLGLALATQTDDGRRVDILTINHSGAPTDTHVEFVELLRATGDGAGAEPLFGSGLGELDLFDLLASNVRVVRSLVHSLGIRHGGGIALHVLAQTLRTAKSSTAYQPYWSGIVEAAGMPGRILVAPVAEENALRALRPGERHLTEEWRSRQAAGPVDFELHWLPFIDEKATSTTDLTAPWEERPEPLLTLRFPQQDWRSDEAGNWAMLAAEMGFNPGNWIRNAAGSIPEPATEFTCARKLAYELSQSGRDVLPPQAYAEVFRTGEIGPDLAAELTARREAKRTAGHVDMA